MLLRTPPNAPSPHLPQGPDTAPGGSRAGPPPSSSRRRPSFPNGSRSSRTSSGMFLEVTGPRGEQETLKDNETRRTNVTRGDGVRAAWGRGAGRARRGRGGAGARHGLRSAPDFAPEGTNEEGKREERVGPRARRRKEMTATRRRKRNRDQNGRRTGGARGWRWKGRRHGNRGRGGGGAMGGGHRDPGRGRDATSGSLEMGGLRGETQGCARRLGDLRARLRLPGKTRDPARRGSRRHAQLGHLDSGPACPVCGHRGL